MLGVTGGRAHVREQFASPASLASYHGRLWRVGQTAAAITCVQDVARRLADSQVPVFTVRPTGPAIASGLELATLIAGRHVLAQSQFAVAMVDVPAFRDGGGRRVSRLAHEESLLTVQRFLVREAQRIDATVSRSGDCGFLVLGTRGSIAATGGERPFAARARTALGLDLEVGVGTGRTEREAEDRARIRLRDQRQAAAVTSGSQPGPPVRVRRRRPASHYSEGRRRAAANRHHPARRPTA